MLGLLGMLTSYTFAACHRRRLMSGRRV
jgi:hypothetical protein